MKPKPMLYSTPMVQAILADRKTMTRRVVKPQPQGNKPLFIYREDGIMASGTEYENVCSRIAVGDVLWVRESFAYNPADVDRPYCYRADEPRTWPWEADEMRWKPSIHMPYAACRIWLEVMGVRVERLSQISENDAIAEGIYSFRHGKFAFPGYLDYGMGTSTSNPVYSYETLWNHINGPDAWEENPFVFVIEFKRIEKPETQK